MLTKFPALQSDDHNDAKQARLSYLLSPDSSVSATGAMERSAGAVLLRGAQTACWAIDRYAVRIHGMTPGFAPDYLRPARCASLHRPFSPGLA